MCVSVLTQISCNKGLCKHDDGDDADGAGGEDEDDDENDEDIFVLMMMTMSDFSGQRVT